MTRIAKALLLASAMALTATAFAQRVSEVTLTADTLPWARLAGHGALNFSEDLIGNLAVIGIQTSVIGPATGSIADAAISIQAPIQSASFRILAEDYPWAEAAYTLLSVGTGGGAVLTAPTANFATSGGQVSVTDITVDLRTQGIYATLAGSHGLSARQVRVWDYAYIDGPTNISGLYYGTARLENQLTGLSITQEAFDLFAQGLGLKAGGIAVMSAIADYGVMTSTLTVVVPFPEPSTYLMMGLGILGVGIVARRRSAA